MTSISDNQNIINKGFENFKIFSKVSYPQGIAIITSILGSVMTDFDISGLKSLLPDEIWENLTENQNLDGTIKGKPNPLLPQPPLGPRPVLPLDMAALTADDYTRINTERNFYNDHAADRLRLQQAYEKFIAVRNYIKTSFIAQANKKDNVAYNALIRNRITGAPDQDGISIESVLQNYVDQYGTADDTAKEIWEAELLKKRKIDEPISEFMIRWTATINTLSINGRPKSDFDLKTKFENATDNDPRCMKFLETFKAQYSNSEA